MDKKRKTKRRYTTSIHINKSLKTKNNNTKNINNNN